uniref:Uncharacterized protein n=1 Tax=Arundo donax TaxID=35708 RepID=A0A0A8XZU6_ARUDO
MLPFCGQSVLCMKTVVLVHRKVDAFRFWTLVGRVDRFHGYNIVQLHFLSWKILSA